MTLWSNYWGELGLQFWFGDLLADRRSPSQVVKGLVGCKSKYTWFRFSLAHRIYCIGSPERAPEVKTPCADSWMRNAGVSRLLESWASWHSFEAAERSFLNLFPRHRRPSERLNTSPRPGRTESCFGKSFPAESDKSVHLAFSRFEQS